MLSTITNWWLLVVSPGAESTPGARTSREIESSNTFSALWATKSDSAGATKAGPAWSTIWAGWRSSVGIGWWWSSIWVRWWSSIARWWRRVSRPGRSFTLFKDLSYTSQKFTVNILSTVIATIIISTTSARAERTKAGWGSILGRWLTGHNDNEGEKSNNLYGTKYRIQITLN